MRSDPSCVARVLWRAGAPPRWQSVKVVQKCDIACTPFRAPHGPRAHSTVLHQCGRKVANPCAQIPATSDACCSVQAHRHAGKVSKWCKSATLLAHPFEHLTDHVPTQQCCTNAVGRSTTSAGKTVFTCPRAVARRRTATLAKCQSGAKVRHCLHNLSSTSRTTCPPNSAAPMR